jgi:hypothetical protein
MKFLLVSTLEAQRPVRKRQINFIINGNAYQHLEELKWKRNASSISQVIRDSIKILYALEGMKEKDGTIMIEKDGKKFKFFI